MASLPTLFESKWPTVILTGIGVANYVVTVSDTAGLHTKQKIALSAVGQTTVEYTIERVLSDTEIQISLFTDPGAGRDRSLQNPTQFIGGMLTMSEQPRNKIGSDIVLRAVYADEPAVALRNLLVNKYGEIIDTTTREDGKVSISVDIGAPPGLPTTDDIKIIRDADEDPTQYQFYLGATLKYTIDVTYDASKNAIEYKTTVI